MGNGGSLGEILRAVREARGWTQAEAAKRIGVVRNTVSRWELGQLKPTGVQRGRALEVYGLVDAPVVPQVSGLLKSAWRRSSAGARSSTGESPRALLSLAVVGSRQRH